MGLVGVPLPGVPRELHLLAFGNTRSAGPWRHPDVDNSPAGVRRRLIARAQTAEAGGFDALFFADGLNYGPPATWAYKTTEDFEPLTTTAALSSVTDAIGLVVTGSATLVPPFQLARQLLSLDHLSDAGRAGTWSPTSHMRRPTTSVPAASSTTTNATRSPGKPSTSSRSCGTAGQTTPSSRTPRPGSSMTSARFGWPITTAGTSTYVGPSVRPDRHKANRCSFRPDRRRRAGGSPPAMPR